MSTTIRIIFAIFDIIFIIIFAFLSNLVSSVPFKGIIEVPKGSATKIISHFSSTSPNFTPLDPHILARLGTVNSGYLDIGEDNLTKIDFLYKLTTAKPAIMDITLIPGETTVIFLKTLAKNKELDFITLEKEYNATTPFYEGFLIPETYHMARGLKEKEIIQNLVEKSNQIHKNLKDGFNENNETKWIEIISKASVIQKEAANIEEMPIVSSVIDNRIQKGMKLQMDGTLNYGEYSHIKVTPDRIKNDTSEFNTYIHEGLPQSPVCTVSVEAIKAALNPAKTEYIYFMRDKKTGVHVFTKSLKEHNEQINIQRNLKN